VNIVPLISGYLSPFFCLAEIAYFPCLLFSLLLDERGRSFASPPSILSGARQPHVNSFRGLPPPPGRLLTASSRFTPFSQSETTSRLVGRPYIYCQSSALFPYIVSYPPKRAKPSVSFLWNCGVFSLHQDLSFRTPTICFSLLSKGTLVLLRCEVSNPLPLLLQDVFFLQLSSLPP